MSLAATTDCLVIQITCFNEAAHIATTLADLPKSMPGFASVKWLIVDDGSSDETLAVVKKIAPDAVLLAELPHRGYGFAYRRGLHHALSLGARAVVTTDADNQYCASDISTLLQPLVSGQADLVVGARPIWSIAEFGLAKKALQSLGSAVVRRLSRTTVRDATSGFRAWAPAAVRAVELRSDYTGTLESLIVAGHCGLRVVSVPVRINPPRRASRLMSSVPSYVLRQSLTMWKTYWRCRRGR